MLAVAVLTPATFSLLRLLLATCATILLAWDLLARRRPDGFQTLRDRALKVLGVLAFLAWWNFGLFPLDGAIHYHEFLHHFVGAKYQHELGYTRLYTCMAAADIDLGHGDDLARRWIRDLETDETRPAYEAAAQADTCRAAFSPERWAAFTADIAWFREHLGQEGWR